ncbi:uncharacterized protein LOC128739501 [Sabethes cyaneus]|uniref:uncharacterized protein LOC128739501 n=1 Tax=Sabethes cyaneus TaxID=53552 RepID=UPI00237EE767|nr:uncharacterized protein LOC128739501 [Sabethes cyaneus]
MGVRHLQTFIQTKVPGGYFKVDIKDEIRKQTGTPLIVIDLKTLCGLISENDRPGLLCGGRYEAVYRQLDRFFHDLTELGVELVFFSHGPVQKLQFDTWERKQLQKYNDSIDIINAIDTEVLNLNTLVDRYRDKIPNNTRYSAQEIAKKHGTYKLAIEIDCDQDLTAYATSHRAMAIITSDTDFLIFDGSWRIWVSSSLDMENLTIFEYSRTNLLQYLKLSAHQLPLLATLSGNDIVNYDEVKRFHARLGNPTQKFFNVANFIRTHLKATVKELVVQGCGKSNPTLENRFQESLDFYKTVCTTIYKITRNHHAHRNILSQDFSASNKNSNRDELLTMLLAQNNEFAYHLWAGKPFELTTYFIDMRSERGGFDYAKLLFPVFERQAGILLWDKPDVQKFTLIVKRSHSASYSREKRRVERPKAITPPSILDLLSDDPLVQADTRDTKLQLFCWIVSDKLDFRCFQSVPQNLWIAVATLHYLIEKKILNLFEADLFLLVSSRVSTETYDPKAVEYPDRLKGRPFRIAFLFTETYRQFLAALERLGFERECAIAYLRFDGSLFHHLYEECRKSEDFFDDIKEWRLYESIVDTR